MSTARFNPDRLDCPICKADWRGPLIPPKDRHLFAGNSPWFSRLIGIELPGYDGVSRWQCPDCSAEWNRWTGKLISPVEG